VSAPAATAPLLGITMGDPAGIGPEITAQALADPSVRKAARVLVIGDARVMEAAARVARVGLAVRRLARVADLTGEPDTIEVVDLANADPDAFAVGRVSAVCGRAAYEYIERGVALATGGEIDAIVTAPINKEALARAGVPHAGHTEILASLTGARAYAMLLMGRELRVIHVTTHVALRRVPELVTRDRVLRTIRLGHEAMRRLGIRLRRGHVPRSGSRAGEDPRLPVRRRDQGLGRPLGRQRDGRAPHPARLGGPRHRLRPRRPRHRQP